MRSNTPVLTTCALVACSCAMLALLALPRRSARGDASAREASHAALLRGSDARFEKRLPPPPPDTSALWRKLTLERLMEERAARYEPLFFAFPSLSDARARAAAAPGDPFEARPLEASAPSARVVGRGNVSGVWEGAT